MKTCKEFYIPCVVRNLLSVYYKEMIQFLLQVSLSNTRNHCMCMWNVKSSLCLVCRLFLVVKMLEKHKHNNRLVVRSINVLGSSVRKRSFIGFQNNRVNIPMWNVLNLITTEVWNLVDPGGLANTKTTKRAARTIQESSQVKKIVYSLKTEYRKDLLNQLDILEFLCEYKKQCGAVVWKWMCKISKRGILER